VLITGPVLVVWDKLVGLCSWHSRALAGRVTPPSNVRLTGCYERLTIAKAMGQYSKLLTRPGKVDC